MRPAATGAPTAAAGDGVQAAGSVGRETVATVREALVAEGRETTMSAVVEVLRASDVTLRGAEDLVATAREVYRQLAGAGRLEPLLMRPGVTDIVVNGPGEVLADSGVGLVGTGVVLATEEEVRALAQRLAARARRRLDDAAPFADGVFAARDGIRWRLHAALPPLAHDGTCLSLRVLRPATTTFEALVDSGSIPGAAAEILRAVVSARLSYLVVGGTGAGKTTLLAGMLGLVPPGERILCVEDSPELAPRHPHVVRLAARGGNSEGVGEIALRDIVRQALRMRPDRIVVGEVRGGEVVDLLAALNTGHDGSAGTIHANAAAEVPARLAALGALGGLDESALAAQVAASIHVVVGVRRAADGARGVAEIGVVLPERTTAGLRIAVVPAWRAAGESSRSVDPGATGQPGARLPGRERLDALLRSRGVSTSSPQGPGPAVPCVVKVAS